MTRDLRIARTNVRQWRGRLVSLSVVVGLGCVIALTSLGVVARAATSTAHRITQGVALRTIAVLAGPANPGATSLTSAHVAQLRALPHVTQVDPSLQATFAVKTPQVVGSLFYATIPQQTALPPITKAVRKDVFPLRPGEVVVPATSQGTDYTRLLGSTVPIAYTRQIAAGAGTSVGGRLTIVGVYDPTYTADGPTAAYANADDVVTWAAARAGVSAPDYLSTVGYGQASVVVDTANAVTAVQATLAHQGYRAQSIHDQLAQLPRELTLIRVLGEVVFGLLLAYTAVAGLALAGSFVRQRTREIGLLKALGFARRRVLRIFLYELLIAGAVPAVIGVVVGNLVAAAVSAGLAGHSVAGVTLPSGVAVPPWRWSAALLLAPVLTVVVGGWLPARKATRLDPDAALREW